MRPVLHFKYETAVKRQRFCIRAQIIGHGHSAMVRFRMLHHHFGVQIVHPTQREFVVQIEQFFRNPPVVKMNRFDCFVFVVAHVVVGVVQILTGWLQSQILKQSICAIRHNAFCNVHRFIRENGA